MDSVTAHNRDTTEQQRVVVSDLKQELAGQSSTSYAYMQST